MKISQTGIDLIKEFEGCYLTAYLCPANVWTIGYGHTGNVTQGMTITAAQAEAYLKADLAEFEGYVSRYVTVPLTQGQFDALVSFAFNCGAGALKDSTLLQLLNKGDYAGAAEQFDRWVYGGGVVLQGLVRRRAAEKALFLSGEGGTALSGIQEFSRSKNGATYLTTNFKVSEMACKDGSDYILIDLALMSYLQKIRDWAGASVTITSGYRNPTYNASIGGATNSYHTKGQAADIVVSGKTTAEVAAYAETLGMKGIMNYETSGFVHVDTRTAQYFAIVKNGVTTTLTTHGGSSGSAGTTLATSEPDENGCPYALGASLIQYGDTGNAVAAVQWYLAKLGNSLEVDGQFGNATKTAVVAFQTECGLDADAVVGEMTKAALKAAVAGLSAADPQNADADFSYTQYLTWREKEDPMINTLADLSAKAPSLYDEVVALIASGAIKGNGTYPIAKRLSVLQAIVVAGRMQNYGVANG